MYLNFSIAMASVSADLYMQNIIHMVPPTEHSLDF